MRNSAAAIWYSVHAERRRLVADLQGLTDDQWRTPSLTGEWDVHDVLAHLVDTAKTTWISFARDMVAARLDFDRANELGLAREKRSDPRDTLASLTEVLDLTCSPPAALPTRLVEAIVHGEDIRRPLGIVGDYPDRAVQQALDYQLRTTISFGGGRERAAGLRLIDARTGVSWGQGLGVEAHPLDLLLAVSGRPVPPWGLTGPGASRLTAG